MRSAFASASARGVLRAAGLVTILTLFSRVAGLIRKLAQSWAMSDGAVAAAYDTANTVPNVLFEVAAGGALAGAVIPLISSFLAHRQRADAEQTASALITWVLAAGSFIALLVFMSAPWIAAALFGAQTDPAVVALAGVFLRVFALQIPLYGLSVVLGGVLQAHGKFVLPAISPLLSSLVVIVAFILYGIHLGPDFDPQEVSGRGVALLAWGTTAGVAAFTLPSLPPVLRLLKIRLTFKFPAGVGRRVLRLAGAGLGALVAQQIALLIIMAVANMRGGIGTFTTFNYAWAVFMVPYAVLAVPIATATFPKISRAASRLRKAQETAAQDRQGASDELHEHEAALQTIIARSTRAVCAMAIIAAAMLYTLASPAGVVLGAGRTIDGLDLALGAMAVGVIGFSILYHGARVLYALDSGRYVIAANTAGWGITAALLLGGVALGVSGRASVLLLIGFAISLGLFCGALVIIWAIGRCAGSRAIHALALSAGLVFVVELAAAFGVRILTDFLLTALGGGMLGAIASSLVGASLVLVVGIAALWVGDRRALAQIRHR